MADIFGSREGFVTVVPTQRVIPGRVSISGFAPKAAMISGISYDQNTNHQFQHALDNSVYIYVFGDLMGNVVIEGRAFPMLCTGEGGLSEVFDFYAKRRASRSPDLIQVAVGAESIVGFLTAIKIRSQTVAEEPTALFQSFWFTINTLPKV